MYSCRRLTLAKWSDMIVEELSFFKFEYALLMFMTGFRIEVFVVEELEEDDVNKLLLTIGRYFLRIS